METRIYNEQNSLWHLREMRRFIFKFRTILPTPRHFQTRSSPLLKIKDAYPKMVIARTRNPLYQYEVVKIVYVADWSLNKQPTS